MDGVLVGHHERIGDGWLTGTTVLLCPRGAVAGVDSRGGAPGTRETDLLDPRTLVERVHAIVLTGGSAFGLAAATGVMDWLEGRGIGFPVGGTVVPIVPAAVVYDLGRGGDFSHRPTAEFGRLACDNATQGAVVQGTVGAGTGAMVGGLKGGVGHARRSVGDLAVEAVVVVNAVGSAVHPRTGRLYGDLDGELSTPDPAELAGLPAPGAPPLATVIGAVLTDAALSVARCQKLAGVAHDGLARAIRPAHSMLDGDTIFGLSSGIRPVGDGYDALLAAAADVFTLAVRNGVLAASSAGGMPSYRDIFRSVRIG